MKKLLQGCLLGAILTLTACSKESLSPEYVAQNGQSARMSAAAAGKTTFASELPGFDEEIFDVPLMIKTSIARGATVGAPIVTKDSALHFFNGDYSNDIVVGEDVPGVVTRSAENILIARNGGLYKQEGRMVVASGYSDTIQLHTVLKAAYAYKVRVEPFNFPPSFSIRILDSKFNTSTNVPLSGVTQLNIIINDVPTNPTDRFRLIVKRN